MSNVDMIPTRTRVGKRQAQVVGEELVRKHDAMAVAKIAAFDHPENSRLQEEYQHRALTYYRAMAVWKNVDEF
jgi:hypothetical protein